MLALFEDTWTFPLSVIFITQIALVFMEDKNLFNPNGQYHGWWSPGDTGSRGINNKDIDLVLPEYSGLSTTRVDTQPQIPTRILFDRIFKQLYVSCHNFPVCTRNDIAHKQRTWYHAVSERLTVNTGHWIKTSLSLYVPFITLHWTYKSILHFINCS